MNHLSHFKTYTVLTAAAICLGLTGCSDKAKDTVHNLKEAPALQGNFADVCSSSKLIGASERIELKFSASDYTRSQIFYSDKTCSTEIGRIDYKGQFVAGAPNKDPTKGGTLDLKVQTAQVKISNQDLANSLNAINYCGHTDYTSGKTVTLTGRQTQGLCPIENVPVTLYTVYAVQNNGLYLGSKDITTMTDNVNKRSAALDYDHSYQKEK